MSVYISSLPEWTGDTYNGYFVWNDSGETQTYKTKFNNTFYNVLQVKQIGFTPNINVNTSFGGIVLGGNNNVGSTDKLNFVMGFDNNVSASGAPDAVGNLTIGRGNNLSSVFARLNIVVGGYNGITQGQNIRFGNNGNNTGQFNIDGGEQNNITGSQNIAWGNFISVSSDYNLSLGLDNDITSSNGYNAITNGRENDIIGTTEYGAIVSSSGSTINNLDRVVILGLHGFSATTSATTYVDSIEAVNNVVLRNYAALDFANDTAAAAGGVVLGGVYHTSGEMKIRIL